MYLFQREVNPRKGKMTRIKASRIMNCLLDMLAIIPQGARITPEKKGTVMRTLNRNFLTDSDLSPYANNVTVARLRINGHMFIGFFQSLISDSRSNIIRFNGIFTRFNLPIKRPGFKISSDVQIIQTDQSFRLGSLTSVRQSKCELLVARFHSKSSLILSRRLKDIERVKNLLSVVSPD